MMRALICAQVQTKRDTRRELDDYIGVLYRATLVGCSSGRVGKVRGIGRRSGSALSGSASEERNVKSEESQCEMWLAPVCDALARGNGVL